MEPRAFGKFMLLEKMGRGSVGTVYRAMDNEAGNIVAIKTFEPTHERPPDVVRRLRDREVRMLISIQHPNVVRYYESGQIGDALYYSMEFVEDSLLKRMREQGEFSLTQKVHILRQTVNALQSMHSQGIVHRDIKPGNILLDEATSGAIHVKVTDLGIAKHVSETDIVREDSSRTVPGTPKYLSPEQIRLKPVDGRADVFGLGVVAYELLTGRAPFEARSNEGYLRANRYQQLRSMLQVRPELPAFLDDMVSRMLARDRDDRYDSDTLARDLDLAYQHLVSDAPLVEQTNPQSMFYVPSEPEAVEEEEVPEQPLRIVPASWAATVALLIIGFIVGAAFWPRGPDIERDGQETPNSSRPTSQELLQRASELNDLREPWSALAIVNAVDPQDLTDAEADDLKRLSGELQAVVGRSAYEVGATMLKQDRLAEARGVLQRMEALLPEAPSTMLLATDIEALRLGEIEASTWQDPIEVPERLLSEGKFSEAISKAEQLLEKCSPKSEEAQLLRRTIVRGLNEWGVALLTETTDAQEIAGFLVLVDRIRHEPWAEGLEDRSCSLFLRLAMYHEQEGRPQQAQEYYRLVTKLCGGETEAAAERAIYRLARSFRLSPIAAEALSTDLAAKGFKSSMLVRDIPEGGTQTIGADKSLLITQSSSPDPSDNACAVERPISNKGFTVSTAFKMKVSGDHAGGGCQVALEIEDRMRNRIALIFDGTSYGVYHAYMSPSIGAFVEGSSRVWDAFGDEQLAWHELRMQYDFELGLISVIVDGQQLERHQVNLEDFTLRVLLRNTGQGECQAYFKDIMCLP